MDLNEKIPTVDEVVAGHVEFALQKYKYNIRLTARKIGISYTTIYRYIKDYDIPIQRRKFERKPLTSFLPTGRIRRPSKAIQKTQKGIGR